MPSYRKRPFWKYAQAAQQVASTAKQAKRLYDSYTSTRKRQRVSSGGITQQHDSRTVYRRKRMPYRKRRAWKKFTQKVNAVQLKSIGSRICLLNKQVTSTAGAVGGPAQSFQFHMIYGKKGDDSNVTSSGVNDIWVAAKTQSSSLLNNEKYYFASAILDLTATNQGTAVQEVDIYHIVFWNEVRDTHPEASVTRAETETSTTTGLTALSMTDRGCTPFEFPLLIRNTGMKILKKMKYFVSPGSAITYQIRDPRNWSVSGTVINEGAGNDSTPNGFIYPGKTQGVMIIHRPVPGTPAGAQQLSVGCTRKYLVKTLESNSNTDGR